MNMTLSDFPIIENEVINLYLNEETFIQGKNKIYPYEYYFSIDYAIPLKFNISNTSSYNTKYAHDIVETYYYDALYAWDSLIKDKLNIGLNDMGFVNFTFYY